MESSSPQSDTQLAQNQVQLYGYKENMPINQTLSNDPNKIFNLYDRQYNIIDINSYEDEIMRCQKVSIILDRNDSGCCGEGTVFFHIVLRDQNYIDKYLFVGTYDLKKEQMFIYFKKPNSVNDITNLCSGFPNVFEAVKNYDKTEGCCGCCENIITPPMSITYMGNNPFGKIEMFYDEGQRLINHQFKDVQGITQYQINPILKKEESNCCSDFCCCDNEKPKPKKKVNDCELCNIKCGKFVCCQNGNNCEYTFSKIASCECECCQCNMDTPYYPYFTSCFKCIACNGCQPIPSEEKEQDYNYLCCLWCYGIRVVEIPVGHLNKPCEWAFSDTDYDEVAEVNLHPNRKNPELRTHVPKDTMCSCYCDCCKCPNKTFSCCGCVCCSNQTKDVHCCSCSKRHFCNCCDCLCLFFSEFYSNAYESLEEREKRLEKEKKNEEANKRKEEEKEKLLKEMGIEEDKEKVIIKYIEMKKEKGCCEDEKVIIAQNTFTIFTPDEPPSGKAKRKKVGRYAVTRYNDHELKTDIFFPINSQFMQRIQFIFFGVYYKMSIIHLQHNSNEKK
jgi:hypothetical protein